MKKATNGSQMQTISDPGQAEAVNISERARALHQEAVIIDAHNDTLILHWALKESMNYAEPCPSRHVDLDRMKAGGLTAMDVMVGGKDLAQSLELWSGMYENVRLNPNDFLLVDSPDDIIRAKREGKIGLIGQLEGCSQLANSLRLIEGMFKLGVRAAALTHSEGGEEHHLQAAPSPFSFCTQDDHQRARYDSCGLTEFGRDAIREFNRQGIVVDLVHLNDAAFFEAIEITKVPVLISHSNVFALSPHWRNLTDDMLNAVKDNGGVLSLAVYLDFVDKDPDHQTIHRFVDHIEYVCERIGDDHVGFGSDFDGFNGVPVIPSCGESPQVTQIMLDRGFSEETILKFWGGNFLRVMREAQRHAGLQTKREDNQ